MEFIDPMAVKEKNKGDMMYSESRICLKNRISS